MTTSLGQTSSLRSYDRPEEKQHYLEIIHNTFPVEFLARIDDLVIFVSPGALFLCPPADGLRCQRIE